MKIGMVCPYGWDTPGGVQSHVRELAQWMIAHGHEVSVLAPIGNESEEIESFVVNAGKPLPIPFNGSTARILFGPIASARVKSWISENDFDLLHLHEAAMPSLSLLALWAAEGPIVGTFHAQMEKVKTIAAIGTILDPAIEKLTAKIAVSQAARETLKERYETEAVVIPNGVAIANYQEISNPARFSGIADGEINIGFIGRFEENRKGLPILLDAWPDVLQKFPKAKLLVAGPSDEKALTTLLSKTNPAIKQSVKFLGRLDEREKVEFFNALDIYIAPNTGGESFGIILVEAMASGAPILASNIEAFQAMLPHGTLFENENSKDLAEKLINLLRAPEKLKELSQEGLDFCKQFDWENVGAAILDVYQIALTGNAKVRLSSTGFLRGRG